jgi:hypothetical protein
MEAEAVVIVLRRSAIGIAVSGCSPSKINRGVYIIAPPRPSIENRTATVNAISIIRKSSMTILYPCKVYNSMESKRNI